MKGSTFLVLMFLLPVLSAAQEHCDPSLSPRVEHPNQYRLIGDRCEGIYFQPVNSTSLTMVSLTDSFENYDLGAGSPLVVEWSSPPSSQNIKLRATSLLPELYYRMDSERLPPETSYRWAIVMLNRLGVERQYLGVIGWTQTPLASGKRVYTPLRIGQHAPTVGDGNYQLRLVPGRELRSVQISLAEVDEEGEPTIYFLEDHLLDRNVYGAGSPFVIALKGFPSAGVYLVEIGAVLRQGGTTDLKFWMYHPGP